MLVTCQICQRARHVGCTREQFEEWKAGALIQKVMPQVPPDERELLISGTCGECFDRMFPQENY